MGTGASLCRTPCSGNGGRASASGTCSGGSATGNDCPLGRNGGTGCHGLLRAFHALAMTRKKQVARNDWKKVGYLQ